MQAQRTVTARESSSPSRKSERTGRCSLTQRSQKVLRLDARASRNVVCAVQGQQCCERVPGWPDGRDEVLPASCAGDAFFYGEYYERRMESLGTRIPDS
jgi:hypothetical protein